MSVLRDNPYGRFNFLVSLGGAQGDGEPGAVVGGFAEVRGLGLEVTYAEYRNGNDRSSTVRKMPGLHRVSDVVLRRGVIGSTDLFDWLKAVRDGASDARTVAITLLNETHEPVATWRLRRAQPKAWAGPLLNAGSSGEVAMEELALVAEAIEFE